MGTKTTAPRSTAEKSGASSIKSFGKGGSWKFAERLFDIAATTADFFIAALEAEKVPNVPDHDDGAPPEYDVGAPVPQRVPGVPENADGASIVDGASQDQGRDDASKVNVDGASPDQGQDGASNGPGAIASHGQGREGVSHGDGLEGAPHGQGPGQRFSAPEGASPTPAPADQASSEEAEPAPPEVEQEGPNAGELVP